MAVRCLVGLLSLILESSLGFAQEPAPTSKTGSAQALITTVYDIRELVIKPSVLGLSGRSFRDADPAEKARRVIRTMSALDSTDKEGARSDQEAIEVVNGT